MRQLAFAMLPLLLAQLGCTVTAVSPQTDPRPSNACASSADCGNGNCLDGLCQTLNGELESLLVTVTPPSDSSVPHLTFVADVEQVPTSGGTKDLVLPGPRHVTGSLSLPKGVTCYPTFANADPKNPTLPAPDAKSLPVTATLALKQRLLGLPQQLYFASASGVKDLNAQGRYTYDLKVPGGEYDIYLVPPANQEQACAIPPQLFRGISIDVTSESEDVDLPLEASPVSKLTLTIEWPRPTSGTGLANWVADIIDPLGGNPISTQVTLDAPDTKVKSQTVDYVAQLLYSAVNEPASADPTVAAPSDLLRLRPPAGLVAPTILLDRSAVGLSDVATARLTAFTQFPSAVHVNGSIERLDDGSPISGFITLISTSIAGVDDGIFASFQTSVQVKDDGVIDVDLPPGSYRVQVVPPAPNGVPPVAGALSAIETTWEVPEEPASQAGRLVELPVIAELSGQARVQGAQVQAVPSPQIVLPFEQAFGAGPFTPRAASALVDDSGHFVMQADPGLYDISVQTSETLGFGWFVRPGLDVAMKDQDLGRVPLPRPAALSGTVTLSGESTGGLSSAALRAYAYLDKSLAYTRDPKLAVSVVEVAETRADEQGAFRLLIPESIAAPSQ